MVTKTGFYPGDPDEPFRKNKKKNSEASGIPGDRSKHREPFQFSSDKHPGTGKNFPDPSARSGKFADWSEDELWNYLKFLNNPPKPDDLEERPEGGYNP